ISRFASAKTCGCAAAGTAVPARKAARVAWAAGRFKSAGPLGWMARREATAQTRRNWGIAPHGRHAFSAGVVLPEPLGEIVHEQPDLDRQIAPVRIDGEDAAAARHPFVEHADELAALQRWLGDEVGQGGEAEAG